MLLAFLAGILSILSPCVLPLLPLVLAGALAEHRLAPLALAAGIAGSFTVIGLFVAAVGFSIGLDANIFRWVAAFLLIALGTVLMVPHAQTRLAIVSGPLADWSHRRFGTVGPVGAWGQFGVGFLLGAVWTPCVGPTLGAASVLAARGENLGSVAVTMLFFGLGVSLPLLLLAFVSREALMRWRGRILGAGSGLKIALGALLVLAGLLTLTGLDRKIQVALENILPDWLIAFAIRI